MVYQIGAKIMMIILNIIQALQSIVKPSTGKQEKIVGRFGWI